MTTHLEPLDDQLFSPLTADEQDAVLGGMKAFTRLGLTQVKGGIENDYSVDG